MAGTNFKVLSDYLPEASEYNFLPFRFTRLETNEVLLVNDLGEWHVLSSALFKSFTEKKLLTNSSDYLDLQAKHFVADSRSPLPGRILASKYKTRKSFLEGFTQLHIFVTSLRCDHSCPYCQVSRQSQDKIKYDMGREISRRSVDLMLKVPAKSITCEFQGGEPLLNFSSVQDIVQYTIEKNHVSKKNVSFVICTNLSMLTDEHLDFCREYDIKISTSLDGPSALHDKNRPLGTVSSHKVVTRNIERAQEALGLENVSALMTTTKDSLAYPKEIVDEYLRLKMGSIFLRSLSPYGFAKKTEKTIGYSMDHFFNFYKTALDYILEINRKGRFFSEAYTALLLQKILTPFPTGFVDLQSPAGAGFGVVVYNFDGDVYASDESRMLAEMDDKSFRLGNVLENSYEEIFLGERMQAIAASSCNESLAGCSDCAFQTFCGADPVYHYATQGDMFGNRTVSGFCKKNMSIFHHLFALLRKDDPKLQEIFWSWIGQKSLREVQLPEVSWLSN